jgi:hypothetical protein
VVVVSEERGDVSLARKKQMIHVEDPEKFSQLVSEGVALYGLAKASWREKIRWLVINQWRVKVGTLFLVSLLWLLLAGQQDFERTFPVLLDVKNVPPQMQILEPLNPRAQVTVRGLRKDASALSDKNVTRDQIQLPNDRIQVVKIEPSQVEFKFKEKP